MKNSLLVVGMVILLASCTQQRYTQQSPEIEVVKTAINNYDYQKWDSLVLHYSDSAKVYYNTRDRYFTAKNLPDYHTKNDSSFLTRAFEDGRREYEMVTDDSGKKWVNFWGIWEGNLLANNKKIQMPVHITYQFVNGKIALEYGYWDASELALELQKIKNMQLVKQDSVLAIE